MGRLSLSSCAALSLAASTPAIAQSAPSFAQVWAEARDAPRLGMLEADVAQAQARALQAGARPNPSLALYAENFAGELVDNARNQQQTTFQLDLPIELGGKRSARIAAGAADVTAARLRGAQGRLAFAGDLARAYGAAEAAGQRVALAQDEVEEAAEDLRVAGALVAAGKEARLRRIQAEAELETMRADLEHARGTLALALARLSALAGKRPAYVAVAPSLLDPPETPPGTALVGPVDPAGSAAVRVAEAEQEAAARQVAVQQRLAIPTVVAQVGVRQLRVASGPAVVMGLTMPLPLFDRNRGNIAAAEAERQGAAARAAAARLDAQAVADTGPLLVAAANRRAVAAGHALATAAQSYRLARVAYEAGKSPLIEVLAARHNLGAARAAVLDAAVARLHARIDLAASRNLTVTGEPVP